MSIQLTCQNEIENVEGYIAGDSYQHSNRSAAQDASKTRQGSHHADCLASQMGGHAVHQRRGGQRDENTG